MQVREDGKPFWRRPHTIVLSLALIAQAVTLLGFSRSEVAPALRPLKSSPVFYGAWEMTVESDIEKEVLDVLRADDTLSRVYRRNDTGRVAGLFVAYFKTQRTGQAPHSPKNCLPGSGWVPTVSDTLTIDRVPGTAAPITVNRYIVSRGDEKSLVLYWYQTPTRVIASEYSAKFYLVVDSIRYHRSDTALVRVIVPVTGDGEAAANEAAMEFVRSFFTPLREFLPS
jgi:EpsI family protein